MKKERYSDIRKRILALIARREKPLTLAEMTMNLNKVTRDEVHEVVLKINQKDLEPVFELIEGRLITKFKAIMPRDEKSLALITAAPTMYKGLKRILNIANHPPRDNAIADIALKSLKSIEGKLL